MSKNVNMFTGSILLRFKNCVKLWHGGTLLSTMYYENLTKTGSCQRIAKLRDNGC